MSWAFSSSPSTSEASARASCAGPLPPYLEKSHGKFRWQILARGRDVKPVLITDLPAGWTVDVDPASVL